MQNQNAKNKFRMLKIKSTKMPVSLSGHLVEMENETYKQELSQLEFSFWQDFKPASQHLPYSCALKSNNCTACEQLVFVCICEPYNPVDVVKLQDKPSAKHLLYDVQQQQMKMLTLGDGLRIEMAYELC